MKKSLLLPILAFLCIAFISCNTDQPQKEVEVEETTFILVRHAEKADDGTDDPPLNEIGKERALALTEHLKETGITAIYSTDYKRTRQTVQQIADQRELEIKSYDPFAENTLDQMFENEAGGIVLISGHSNTTPLLVNRLIGEERYQQFDDSDYDNLFIVVAEEKGDGTVVRLTF